MHITYDDIQLLVELENKVNINDEISCFDYVSDIYIRDSLWVVGVFVEPVGSIEVKGPILRDVLSFWLELFRSQPGDWNYMKAGGHLRRYLAIETFDWKQPDDARKVWMVGVNADV